MNNPTGSLAGNPLDYPGAGAHHSRAKQVDGRGLVHLSGIVQGTLAAYKQKIEQLQAIIRFDPLPWVQGEPGDWYYFFDSIIGSIVHYPPVNNKLFIYIRCEKQRSEIMDLALPEGFQKYLISVYTNIVANAEWQELQQQNLEKSRDVISAVHGSLTCYNISNTGCLYDMDVPGKLS